MNAVIDSKSNIPNLISDSFSFYDNWWVDALLPELKLHYLEVDSPTCQPLGA